MAAIATRCAQFAEHMAYRIWLNRHKGLRRTWLDRSWDAQQIELRVNVDELRTAIAYGLDILDKAADVAVDAFIIADNWHEHQGIAEGPHASSLPS